MQPSGNHQVKHQKQIVLEAKNNPFAKSAKFETFFPIAYSSGGVTERSKNGFSKRMLSNPLVEYPAFEKLVRDTRRYL